MVYVMMRAFAYAHLPKESVGVCELLLHTSRHEEPQSAPEGRDHRLEDLSSLNTTREIYEVEDCGLRCSPSGSKGSRMFFLCGLSEAMTRRATHLLPARTSEYQRLRSSGAHV